MKYRQNIIKNLLPYTHGVRKHFLLIFLCTLLLMGLELVTPILYRLFIDEVILNKNFPLMKVLFVEYLILFFITALTGYLKTRSEYTFLHQILYGVKEKIFCGYLRTDFTECDSVEVGEMKMRLEDDTSPLREYTTTQTIDYSISFLTMILCAILLFFTDWRLALFSLAAIPVTFFLDDLVSRYEKDINAIKRDNARQKTSFLQASLQGWREVKALGLGRWQLRHFLKYVHVQALCNAKWINCWTARVLIIPKIKEEFFMRFGLYFLGGLFIAKKALDIGDLLVFVVYYEMMANAMKRVSTANAQLQSDMPMLERLLEQLGKSNPHCPFSEPSLHCFDSFTGIDMINVTYQYPGAPQAVIKDFHLHIAPGERIALVGKSGAGKSTVLKLLTGMLIPTSGQVLFSGHDLQTASKEPFLSRIGFVMQDNMLFHMSIRENLRYGKSDATEAEMWAACEKAQISEFIRTLPQGLDTIIGEKGLKLSGGQRQRIVLARLFLQDVDIYILDEATSALDEYNESLIQATLQSLGREKTLIVVAHRKSSIALCDRVVTIE